MMKPSWKSSVERGREPGVMPPMSAWWARLATKPTRASRRRREFASVCRLGWPFDRLRANGAVRGGEDGGDEGDVVEVGAAEVGVVEDDDVARGEVEALEGGGDGGGHGAEVDGDVGGLGDHVAVGVKEGAGEVLALLDVGGEAGAAEGDAHLLGHGGEEVLEDLEGYGVDGHWLLRAG